MSWLLFSYVSTAFFMASLVGMILVALILNIKKKASHTWLLAGYFFVYAMMNLGGMLVLSRPTDSMVYAYAMVVLFLLLGPLLLQFAYHFPANIHRGESKGMLLFSIAAMAMLIWTLTVFVKFDSSGWLVGVEDLNGFMLAVMFSISFLHLWTFVVWVRKILWIEKDQEHFWLRKVFLPSHHHAKALRSFMLLFSITFLFPVLDILQFKGFITQEQQYLIFVFFGLLMFALFFLIYIEHFPEQSSLMAKLLGACLLLVLPIMMHDGYLADKMMREIWDANRVKEVQLYEMHLRDGRQWLKPPHLRYIMSYPEVEAPEPEDYRMEFTADPSLSTDRFSQFDEGFRKRIQFRETSGPMKAREATRPVYAYRERAADVHALKLLDRYIHFDFIWEGRRYELGYSYLDFRRALSPPNLYLAFSLVLVLIVVFLFLPILYKHMLVRPLDALTQSVREAKAGNMDVTAPVYAEDEIGFLARSFNSMLTAFRAAQNRIRKEVARGAQLEAENARKDQELEQAHRLQLAMLPKTVPDLPDLEIAVFMKPATEVGGDYYDFRTNHSGQLTVCVGDATGHGLQAGTMVAATKSLFNAMADHQEPVAFLVDASRALADMGYKNMYMALMVARIHDGLVNLTSAGMPFALIYRSANKALEEVRLPGLPLGSKIKFPYRTEQFHLHPGDALLLKSDGLEERFSENDQLMGDKQVGRIFAENAHLSADRIIQALVAAGEAWGKSRPQDDDITLVVLKRKVEAIS